MVGMPPRVTGQLVVILTVTDAARSATWYEALLGAYEASRYGEPGGSMQVVIGAPSIGLELCFASRAGSEPDAFDERRVGLDHLEFLVASRAELDRWVDHLDYLGVEHSGVKEPAYSSAAMITLRDPDNIQLELYWPGQPRSGPQRSEDMRSGSRAEPGP
jgi:glyoxylase I family protein